MAASATTFTCGVDKKQEMEVAGLPNKNNKKAKQMKNMAKRTKNMAKRNIIMAKQQKKASK